MDDLHIGTQSVRFDAPPSILSFAAIGGKKEQEGPLASYFDFLSSDTTFGQKSWEKAESELQKRALDTALHKLDVKYKDLDALFAGDLLNQCIGSAFAMRETGIPFLGLYGACSTMAESLLLASAAVNAGYAHRAAALTSSHFASAERQYRFPLGYGGQRALRLPAAADAGRIAEKPALLRDGRAALARVDVAGRIHPRHLPRGGHFGGEAVKQWNI